MFFAIQQTHFSQLRIFYICVCIGKWLVKYECKIAEFYIWSLKYFSANMYKIVRKDILLQYNWLNNYRCLVAFESTCLDLTNDLTVQCIVYRVVTSKYLLSFVRSSASLIPLIWVQKRNSTLQMGFHNVIQYQLFNIMSRMTFCSDSEKVITGHADPVSFYCIFTLPYTYMSILSAEWHYFMKLPVSYFWF